MGVAGEKENGLEDLKMMFTERDLMGKYNRKFLKDYHSKIIKIINKLEANDSSVTADIKVVIQNLDPAKKKDTALSMKEFGKISDGSLFFEEYNSNDWNRI